MEISLVQSAELNQVMDVMGKTTVEELLRNLFSDRCSRLVVEALTPGISGSFVLLVKPEGEERGAEKPCVVKVGPSTDIERELAAYRKYVEPYQENRYLPGIKGHTLRSGEQPGAISYGFFASRTLASSLSEYQASGDSTAVADALSELFRLTNEWSGSRQSVHRNLLQELYPATEEQFDEFERRAVELERSVAPFKQDWTVTQKVWNGEIPTSLRSEQLLSIRHGDLHSRNVLVADDGELCLIDFMYCDWHHFVKDYVTLEADLVLRVFAPHEESPKDYLHLIKGFYVLEDFSEDALEKAAAPSLSRNTALAAVALKVVRQEAWRRMELSADEVPGYYIGVMRRMLSMTIRSDSGLTDAQRWIGVSLISLMSAHVSGQSAPPNIPIEDGTSDATDLTNLPPLSPRLVEKLSCIAGQEVPAIVLVGGVYLDLIIYPVDTVTLTGDEWSNIEPLEISIGGSAYYVGRYLFDRYGQPSTLVTIVGDGDDPLSAEAEDLLKKEEWIQNEANLGPPGSTTPVSIHLLQRSEAFSTAFTQRGALANLEWWHITQHLSQLRHESALIYLSSYFRTDLHVGLAGNLRNLSRQHVIALDHGRITPAVAHRSSVTALKEAFRRGYIDFYTCRFDDLWTFAHFADWRPPPPPDARGKEDLRALSHMLRLPPVTIVRDDHWPEPGSAYVLLGERVELVSTDTDESVHPTGGVRPKNAFNAAFIRTLLRAGAVAEDPMRTVIESTQAGLAAWLDQS